jgi:hypothetical protein
MCFGVVSFLYHHSKADVDSSRVGHYTFTSNPPWHWKTETTLMYRTHFQKRDVMSLHSTYIMPWMYCWESTSLANRWTLLVDVQKEKQAELQLKADALGSNPGYVGTHAYISKIEKTVVTTYWLHVTPGILSGTSSNSGQGETVRTHQPVTPWRPSRTREFHIHSAPC